MTKLFYKYDWKNKDLFIKNIAEHSTMSNFLLKNGLGATSGNFKTFKKWAFIHDVDLNSYKKIRTKEKYIKRKVIDNEILFSKNILIGVNEIKKALRKNNLIEYKCMDCNNKGIWNNKKLQLQLEHKNGDNTDNRLENLTYLCPNCHSQTDTYGSKNYHKKLFKDRLNDLLSLKDVNENNLEILIKKWDLSYSTVKRWIHTHSEKIKSFGISISINNQHKPPIDFAPILNEVLHSDLKKETLINIGHKYKISYSLLMRLIKTNDNNVYCLILKQI